MLVPTEQPALQEPLWPVPRARVPHGTPETCGVWAVGENRSANAMLHLLDKGKTTVKPILFFCICCMGRKAHSTHPTPQARNEVLKLKSWHLGKQEGESLRSSTSLMLQDHPCYFFWSYLYALNIFLLSKFRAFKLINVFLWEISSFLHFDKKNSVLFPRQNCQVKKHDWGKWDLCRLEWAPCCCSCGRVAKCLQHSNGKVAGVYCQLQHLPPFGITAQVCLNSAAGYWGQSGYSLCLPFLSVLHPCPPLQCHAISWVKS